MALDTTRKSETDPTPPAAGDGIRILNPATGAIEWGPVGGGGGGDINNADNVGTGAGEIFARKDGTNLLFRRVAVDSTMALDTDTTTTDTVSFRVLPDQVLNAGLFRQLSDTPNSYIGQQGKICAVNAGEDAIIFIDPPSGGQTGSLIWCTGVSGPANPFNFTYFTNPGGFDTVPSQKVITAFTADQAADVTIAIEVDAVHLQTQWNPNATISYIGTSGPAGDVFTLSQVDNSRRFSGQITIQLQGSQSITLNTSDGGEFLVAYTPAAAPPNVTNVVWDGNYPSYIDPRGQSAPQTAVKQGDMLTYAVTIDADAAQIVLDNFELGTSTIYDNGGAGYTAGTHNLTMTCSNSGNRRTRWEARTASGTAGSNFTVAAGSSPFVDQTSPSVTNVGQAAITYPAGQFALKASEQATVAYSLNNWAPVNGNPAGNAPYAELNDTDGEVRPVGATGATFYVEDPAASFNQIWERIGGNYELDNNARIRAIKTSNGTVSNWENYPIYVANVAAALTVREGTSGSAQVTAPSTDAPGADTTVGLLFTQLMIGTTVNIKRQSTDGSAATLPATSPTSNATAYTTTMTQQHADPKGPFNFENTGGIFGKNLAGIDTTVIGTNPQYLLQGFLPITVSRPALSSQREFALDGTTVENIASVTALRAPAQNLTLFTYTEGQNVLSENESGGFTITNGSGEYAAKGTHFLWLDITQSNTLLPESFTIEEPS